MERVVRHSRELGEQVPKIQMGMRFTQWEFAQKREMSFPIDLYKSMFIDNFLQSDDFLKLKQYLSEDMINIINTCTNYVIQSI